MMNNQAIFVSVQVYGQAKTALIKTFVRQTRAKIMVPALTKQELVINATAPMDFKELIVKAKSTSANQIPVKIMAPA